MSPIRNKKVIGELKRIAKQNGGILQPETVVSEARKQTSPLHSRFEWNDGVAAEQWRLQQARQLIRVTVQILPGENKETQVFVSLTPDREETAGGYRIVAEVLSDEQLRAQMLADALAELELFRAKYKRLKELAAVFEALETIKK